PSHSIELKDLIKIRRKELETEKWSPEVKKSVEDDLKKIQEYVTLEFTKEGVTTLAIFSCCALKFWKVVTFQIPIRSQLVVQAQPFYRPLSAALDQQKRFLFILIERAKARLFEISTGEILEHSDVLDDVPSRVKEGGFGGYEERRIERHIDDHIRRHFKHVAETADHFSKKYSTDYVILAGSETNTSEFRQYLPNGLSQKVVAVMHEEMTASAKDILEKTMHVEKEMRQKEETQLLNQLFTEVNSGGLGIVGLDSTLRALQRGQVNQLLVQEGFEREGYQCVSCMSLHIKNGACDFCGAKTDSVPDIVAEAVQDAMKKGCQVKYISLAGSQLAAAGNIGAVLRFKP
ncbi:MAG TPA: Vms1/Ankzf1 family peptidyl-tRNA hydrolase, partial [Acidobacteriota bacterium]|nr:Vms1/Ankzf1 family peptidyl-tRNA hydrolase [Acidobacteriota bacterium]